MSEAAQPPEGRPHLVVLGVFITAEVEVLAQDRREAESLALARAAEAQRQLKTAPYVFRVYTRHRDPHDRTKWIWAEP